MEQRFSAPISPGAALCAGCGIPRPSAAAPDRWRCPDCGHFNVLAFGARFGWLHRLGARIVRVDGVRVMAAAGLVAGLFNLCGFVRPPGLMWAAISAYLLLRPRR